MMCCKRSNPALTSVQYSMTECIPAIWEEMQCACKAQSCRGTITGSDFKNKTLRDKYKGHFTSTVQARIDTLFAPASAFGTGGNAELARAVEVRPHPNPIIGRGLFATERIAKGEVVWAARLQRDLELPLDIRTALDVPAAEREWRQHYGYQTGEYEFSVPKTRDVIDQGLDNSFFMNHSCDPTIRILDDDVWVAARDVEVGEELTYDYGTTESFFDRLPACACGTALCRGKVTKDDWRSPVLRRRYGLCFASYLQEKIMAEEQPLSPEPGQE